MFKFVPGQVRHAWWPVEWTGVTEEGEPVANKIEMRFVLQDDAAYQTLTTETAPALDERWAELKGAERETAQRGARADLVFLLATGWRLVEDENGAPFPWSRDVLGQFLMIPGVITAVLQAHKAARRGDRPNG
jgi:hypothetical protein